MDYIYLGAAFIGTGWTFYLVGQFSGTKEFNRRLNAQRLEMDRMADVIGKYQAKQPERTADGKFASKRERVTAELAAYVAERKAA
jgi:hypothetical protein